MQLGLRLVLLRLRRRENVATRQRDVAADTTTAATRSDLPLIVLPSLVFIIRPTTVARIYNDSTRITTAES